MRQQLKRKVSNGAASGGDIQTYIVVGNKACATSRRSRRKYKACCYSSAMLSASGPSGRQTGSSKNSLAFFNVMFRVYRWNVARHMARHAARATMRHGATWRGHQQWSTTAAATKHRPLVTSWVVNTMPMLLLQAHPTTTTTTTIPLYSITTTIYYYYYYYYYYTTTIYNYTTTTITVNTVNNI